MTSSTYAFVLWAVSPKSYREINYFLVYFGKNKFVSIFIQFVLWIKFCANS
jgi:hypothetical protein